MSLQWLQSVCCHFDGQPPSVWSHHWSHDQKMGGKIKFISPIVVVDVPRYYSNLSITLGKTVTACVNVLRPFIMYSVMNDQQLIQTNFWTDIKLIVFSPNPGYNHQQRGGKIAQSLASLSIKRAIRVHARHDPLVIRRWNSITVLLTHSHQCRRLVKKRPSMCYYVCVIMHVKDP